MRYSVLSAFSESIPYIPGLRELTGSASSAILMMQLEYWFSRYPEGFYKFLEPPSKPHSDYTPGDSWTEELAFGKDEFRAAFDRIGVRFSSKTQYEEAKKTGAEFEDKYYCSYFDRQSGLTFYHRSHDQLTQFVSEIQPRYKGTGKKSRKKSSHLPPNLREMGNSDLQEIGADSDLQEMGNSDFPTSEDPIYRSGNFRFTDPYIYSETTTEITTDKCVYTRAQENQENTHTGFGKIQEPETRATERLSSTQVINLESVQQIQSLDKDQSSGAVLTKKSTKYDSALGMRPPAPRVKYLIPDGDWLNEKGQLDPAFINHVAKQWMDSPGAAFHKMPIEEVEGKVFSHFANNHAKLVVAWESYSKVALRHAKNVKTRLDSEISISESEQQQVINQGRAIASALSQPEEEKAVPTLPTQEDRKPFGFVLPETAPEAEPKALRPVEIPRDEDGTAYNPDAYQVYTAEEISPDKQQANLAKLSQLIRTNLRTLPTHKQNVKRAGASFPSNLSEANQWILDPCLRSQAVTWAKREGYLIHFTPEGVAFEIEDPEF